MTLRPEDDGPTTLGDVPAQEGVSQADAAGRADLSPEEQQSLTDRDSHPVGEPPQFEHLPGGPTGGRTHDEEGHA
jgi:hypothetical protein